MNINVSQDAVHALDRLSQEIQAHSQELLDLAGHLHGVYDDLKDGLGPHTGQIAALLEELDRLAHEADRENRKLARKAKRAALIRRQLRDDTPYRPESLDPEEYHIPEVLGQVYDALARQGIHPRELGPGNSSPYIKTTYQGTISYTDPQTGQLLEKTSTRDVYENSSIDPEAVIPAGTKYPNGQVVRKDTTNLDLMKAGKAPFVSVSRSDGGSALVLVELHHLSGEETRHGSAYFTGAERDGSLVEIASTTHDAYSRQLHMGGASFRRDAAGNKTADAAKYETFRAAYWKHRAQKYLAKNGGSI